MPDSVWGTVCILEIVFPLLYLVRLKAGNEQLCTSVLLPYYINLISVWIAHSDVYIIAPFSLCEQWTVIKLPVIDQTLAHRWIMVEGTIVLCIRYVENNTRPLWQDEKSGTCINCPYVIA